jgi:hypothetical protein
MNFERGLENVDCKAKDRSAPQRYESRSGSESQENDQSPVRAHPQGAKVAKERRAHA